MGPDTVSLFLLHSLDKYLRWLLQGCMFELLALFGFDSFDPNVSFTNTNQAKTPFRCQPHKEVSSNSLIRKVHACIQASDPIECGNEDLAILRGENVIRQGDIDIVAWLSNWINSDFKEL